MRLGFIKTYIGKATMALCMAFIFLLLFGMTKVSALQFSISGYVLDEGVIGGPSSPSAYARVTFTRDGIAGTCVTSLSSIYPGDGTTFPMSYDRDCGSLEWASNPPAEGQVVTAFIEVRNGLNGWTGSDYTATVTDTITADDMLAADMSMPAANLQEELPPEPDRIAILNSPADSIAGQDPTTLSPMTVETRSTDGNPANVVSDTTVNLTSSSSGSNSNPKFYSVSAGVCTTTEITTVTIVTGNSTAQFCYGDEKSGTFDITASVTGWATDYLPSTKPATILAGSLSEFLLNFASSQRNRVAFTGTNTITAVDSFGNIITNFDASADNLTLSSSPSGLDINGLDGVSEDQLISAGDFVDGIADISGLIYVQASSLGNYTFTATAVSGAVGTSSTVTITAGVLNYFEWSLSTPQRIAIGFTGTNTLTAKDADGFTVIDFDASTQNVTITESLGSGSVSGLGSGGNNILDQSSDFTSGVADLTGVMIYTGLVGDHQFSAVSGSANDTSSIVSFTYGDLDYFNLVFNSPQSNDEWFSSATITALDAGGNSVENFDASVNNVTISASNGVMSINGRTSAVLDQGVDFVNGVADLSGSQIKFTGTAGSQTITADSNNAKTGSTTVEITAGSLDSIRINNGSTAGASEVGDHAMSAGQTLSLWAAGYDVSGNFISLQSVDWSSTGTLDTVSQIAVNTIVFTPSSAPTSGQIEITNGVLNDSTGTITVNVAALDHFDVSVPASAVAGVSFVPISISAVDTLGNVVTSYSGTKVLTISGASNGIESGSPTSSITVEFVDGQATTSSNIVLVKAESINLTFTEGSLSGVSNLITVTSNDADHFHVEAPGSVTAGVEFSLNTIYTHDVYGNPATTYDGTKNISYSGPGTSDNADVPLYTEVVNFSGGTATTTLFTTLYKKESVQITASDGTINGTSNTIVVNSSGADSIEYLSGDSQTATIGTYLSNSIQTIVKDQYGNPVSGQTVNFSVTNGGGSVDDVSVVTSSDGIAQTSWRLGSVAGADNNQVEASAAGLSGSPVIFTASATASDASVLEIVVPSTATAGVGFFIDIRVNDSSGNLVSSYSGLKTISYSGPSNSPKGDVPVYTTSVNFVGGQALDLATTLYKAETVSITADIADDSIVGTSDPIDVIANTAAEFNIQAPSSANSGQAFQLVSFRTNDAYGNFANDYSGVKNLTFSGPSDGIDGSTPIYPSSVEFIDGVGITNFDITLYKAETTPLEVTDGTISGVSNDIQVVYNQDYVLFYISGDGQSGSAGVQLTEPLVVAVYDSYGDAATDKIVEFNPSHGSMSDYTSGVGSDGQSSSYWTLGDQSGTQSVVASVVGITETITFTAESVSRNALSIDIVEPYANTSPGVSTTAISVCLLDNTGNVTTESIDVVLDLTSDGSGGSFSVDSSDWEETSVRIPAGTSCADFYYKNNTVGTFVITATDADDFLGQDTMIVVVDEEGSDTGTSDGETETVVQTNTVYRDRIVTDSKDSSNNSYLNIILNKYIGDQSSVNYELPEVPIILSPKSNTTISSNGQIIVSGLAPASKVVVLYDSAGNILGSATSDNSGYWKIYASQGRFSTQYVTIHARIINTTLTSQHVQFRIEPDEFYRFNLFNF